MDSNLIEATNERAYFVRYLELAFIVDGKHKKLKHDSIFLGQDIAVKAALGDIFKNFPEAKHIALFKSEIEIRKGIIK